MTSEIKIYVADLAAYNNGKLHGVWIDATQNPDDIHEQIKQMLEESPEELAEEYAIHDYYGFNGYRPSKYEDIDLLHDIACFIKNNPVLAGALLHHFSGDVEEAKKAVEESYSGCYTSLADYAQALTQETTQIPETLVFYIDYKKMAYERKQPLEPVHNRLIWLQLLLIFVVGLEWRRS